jgi:hypothetical protein
MNQISKQNEWILREHDIDLRKKCLMLQAHNLTLNTTSMDAALRQRKITGQQGK